MFSSTLVHGRLDAFFETGTEGVIWSITLDGVPGYDQLFTLRDGDALLIYGSDGQVAWQGTVALEYARRWQPYPDGDPGQGQQEVLGFWVHGFQEDMDPEVWAQYFFDGAPAVARVYRDPHLFADTPVLTAALDGLTLDAEQALLRLHAQAPALGQRIEASLPHALGYACQQMGWSVPALATPNERAQAWRLLLALERARRGLWQPEQEEAFGVVRERWPTRDSFDEAHVRFWLAHRLPQDAAFSVGD